MEKFQIGSCFDMAIFLYAFEVKLRIMFFTDD